MTKNPGILVTGGTGYIGSHTVVELIEKGYDVFIIDNLSNSHAEVIDSIEAITGTRPGFGNIDLNNKSAVQEFLRIHKVEAIIHFAAFKAVGESVEKPIEYYRNNLVSLLNLIEICKENKIKNFVFSSSCSVYGEPDYLPIDELRYFNPVGAHTSAKIGEYPVGTPLNLFPIVAQTAIGKRTQMKVFGTDYNTPDGSCLRDYIHVVDVARAHVVAIERMLSAKTKNKYELFNLGTGNGISVMEIIKTFEAVTGVKVNYECVPRRSGDVEKVYADTKYANTELGWKTTHSLENMITSAWAWEQVLQKKSMATSK